MPAPRKAHIWPRVEDSWYQEPAWCAERLFDVETFVGAIIDPCAGAGTIPAAARRAGHCARGFDLRNRGLPDVTGGCDFFFFASGSLPGLGWPVDNIVCNPPFGTWSQLGQTPPPDALPRVEDEFVRLALDRALGKVAVFLPLTWLTGLRRAAWLRTLPLHRIHVLCPRPSCPPGEWLRAGNKATGGTSDFCWMVFSRQTPPPSPELHWLEK